MRRLGPKAALAILHGPHWLSAFKGEARFPHEAQRAMTHQRVLALRESQFVGDLFRKDRFARRWIYSRDMLMVLGLILTDSRLEDDQRLARISEDRLLRTFGQRWMPLRRRLHYASQEGYVAVTRFVREDGPYLRLIALPPLLHEVAAITEHALAYYDAVGDVRLRLSDFTGEARWGAIVVSNLMLVGLGARLRSRGLRIDCINFFFVIFDLFTYGPCGRIRFARQEAQRLGVSVSTLLAVIEYAKTTGWVVDHEVLQLTPLGHARISTALAVVSARAHALGSLLDHCREAGELPVPARQIFPALEA